MNRFRAFALPLLLALPALAQAPAAVPKAPDASFFSLEAKPLSLACARESLRLNPRDPQLRAAYGELLLGQGDRAGAEAAFSEARDTAHNDPRVWRLIGQAWLRHGFQKEALAAYQDLTTLNLAGRWESRKGLFTTAAEDLMAAGLAQPATGYMEHAYALDRHDAENPLAFARAALRAGQRDLAALWFSRAVQASPKDEDVWMEIATCYADDLVAQRKPRAYTPEPGHDAPAPKP